MKKRLLSAILAVGMLASMLPVSAFAEEPTATPTVAPTEEPAATPTVAPTEEPTATPTVTPAEEPTATPTATPVEQPTATPTATPVEEPTATPTVTPAGEPTATPTVTPAGEPGEVEFILVDSYTPDADWLPDDDELFAGYVQTTLYDMGGIATMGEYGETLKDSDPLTYKMYSALKPQIQAIAAGESANTKLEVTAADLGVSLGDSSEAVIASFHKVIPLLLADCPYDLYWYEKTESTGLSSASDGSRITIAFPVSDAYKGADATTTDTDKTGATAAAVTEAKKVVSDNAGKNDYEKLIAYRNYICNNVSYNSGATAAGTPYGDPGN